MDNTSIQLWALIIINLVSARAAQVGESLKVGLCSRFYIGLKGLSLNAYKIHHIVSGQPSNLPLVKISYTLDTGTYRWQVTIVNIFKSNFLLMWGQ